MDVTCTGRRSQAAATALLLAGCAQAAAQGAPPQASVLALGVPGATWPGVSPVVWWVALLVLLLVTLLAAAAGHTIGMLRARRLHESALRQARAALRDLTALHHGWLWHTGPTHRLLSWQGPGQSAQSQCTLFDDALLDARLRAQQAFSGLRLRAAAPHEGSVGWLVDGLPLHDDLGAFCGFAGSARPCDSADVQQAAAAALMPALHLHPAPVLLATHDGQAWRVQRFNLPAHRLWPGLDSGAALLGLLQTLPDATPVISQALLTHPAPATDAEGWQLVPLPAQAGAPPALLLARQSSTSSAAGSAADAKAAGSETAANAESDTFSFTVSHDLRAPIRVVEGFTRIVKEDYGRLLDRVGNDHLDRVLSAAARMNLMIDALLTLARLSSQPLAQQPVNLSQLAAFVIDDLRRGAPERVADIDIEPHLAAQGDPTLLRLVLENLLGNAWKYSARCARAQISLGTLQGDGLGGPGSRRVYVVRDNGAGFDMRSADRLFGLFQRLHSASEFAGHGVGLASVRRIVRRHGGDIWAEAEPGKGAAFFFTLAG